MLPDLEPPTDVEIVAENIRVIGVIYSLSLLERSGVYRVADRIVELYAQGLLPLGQDPVGRWLAELAQAPDRSTAQERARLYALALGVPGGDTGDAEPNRAFLTLWLRFLAAVSLYAGEHGTAELVAPPTARNAAVREGARTLALNASAHGGGLVANAAGRLVLEVRHLFDVLRQPPLQNAFGVRGVWSLIEHVHRNHLGGPSNVVRYRAQAEAGSRIFDWLASHAALLQKPGRRRSSRRADTHLAEAVEQLLAASGPSPDAVMEAALGASTGRTTLRIAADALLQALELGADRSGVRGMAAVLHGAPGTGKTLAAHALAQVLARPLYRLDLAAVTSKYIGETEKNLERIFEHAEKVGALLLIDEADALFGRRTDVRDAHDRYANAAVEVLRARLEHDAVPVVLTVSTEVDIDAALADEGWQRRRWRVVRTPLPRS